MKRACEADKSVGNSDFCCLGEIVIGNFVLFSLSRCPRLVVVSGMKCDALPGCLVGTGCGGSAGRRGGNNRQGFWEDAYCVGMTVVRDKFNKLCCISCHSAIGVGMGFMGQCDNASASNREARGGQLVCGNCWGECLLILGGFFHCYVSGVCVVRATERTLNCGSCSVCPLQALEKLWRGKKHIRSSTPMCRVQCAFPIQITLSDGESIPFHVACPLLYQMGRRCHQHRGIVIFRMCCISME